MTTTQKIYLAGFFDGEGSVMTGHEWNKKGKRHNFRISFSVCNTNKEVIFWTQKITGCGMIFRRKKEGNRKVQWTLTTRNQKETLKLLEIVYPYLKVKKQIVKFAIQFLKSRVSFIPTGRKKLNRYSSPWYSVKERNLFWKIRKLNQKGKPINPSL